MRNTIKLPYEEASLEVLTLADVITTSGNSWEPGGEENRDDGGWTH